MVMEEIDGIVRISIQLIQVRPLLPPLVWSFNADLSVNINGMPGYVYSTGMGIDG